MQCKNNTAVQCYEVAHDVNFRQMLDNMKNTDFQYIVGKINFVYDEKSVEENRNR